MTREEFDQRLQYGPAMRWERVVEGGFLGAAFFTGDPRFAWVTFVLTALQALAPRLAPIAAMVALFIRYKPQHALGDLYFDLSGGRGACSISAVIQALGLWLIHSGFGAWGMLVLALPTASFLLSPTVGFCCGCACYVIGREALVRAGLLRKFPDGSHDVDIESGTARR